jgi:hypothetical protein
LAAAALARNAQALISADADFSSVARLNHIAPGSERFEALFG